MQQRSINLWMWQDAFGFVQANEVSEVQRVILCGVRAAAGAGQALPRRLWGSHACHAMRLRISRLIRGATELGRGSFIS
jgi:hypothetical protein